MRTPQAVKEAAKFLTDDCATKYRHVGQYNGYEVYTIDFLEDVTIGFPWVFLYKEVEDVIELNSKIEEQEKEIEKYRMRLSTNPDVILACVKEA